MKKKHLSVGSTRRVHSTYFFFFFCSCLEGYILPRILIMASRWSARAFLRILSLFFRRHDELSTIFEIISLTYFSTHSARTKPEIISISKHFCCCFSLRPKAFWWRKRNQMLLYMTKKYFRCLNTWVLYTIHQKWFINFFMSVSVCFFLLVVRFFFRRAPI